MMHAVILAGGTGRRFWPKSRRKTPKQFLYITRSYSPIQNLYKIIKSEIPPERIWVVTNKKYVSSLRVYLPALHLSHFLIEPQAKNTAAAIGLASFIVKRIDPQAVTLVLSSDHLIKPKECFLRTIKNACRQAQEQDILVTLGIPPQRPTQEFGYLKIGKRLKVIGKSRKIYKVEKFIEKPSIKRAKAYLKNRSYLWNSGIFVWKAAAILEAIKRYLPKLYAGLKRIEKARGGPFYQNQLAREYRRFRDISIDYGVMEKAGNVYTVVGDFLWQDVGAWTNLSTSFFPKDSRGNIIQGLHRGIDTRDSVIFGEHRHLIATLGLRDLIIAHTPSATLVCKKDHAQDLKKLLKLLEKNKRLRKYL